MSHICPSEGCRSRDHQATNESQWNFKATLHSAMLTSNKNTWFPFWSPCPGPSVLPAPRATPDIGSLLPVAPPCGTHRSLTIPSHMARKAASIPKPRSYLDNTCPQLASSFTPALRILNLLQQNPPRIVKSVTLLSPISLSGSILVLLSWVTMLVDEDYPWRKVSQSYALSFETVFGGCGDQ